MNFKLFLLGLLSSYLSCAYAQYPCYDYDPNHPSYYCSQYINSYQIPQSSTYASYYQHTPSYKITQPNTYMSYYQETPSYESSQKNYFYYYLFSQHQQEKPSHNTTIPVTSSAYITKVSNLIDVYTQMFIAFIINVIFI